MAIKQLREPGFVLVDFVMESQCADELVEDLLTICPDLDLPEPLTADQAAGILVEYVLARSPKLYRLLELPDRKKDRSRDHIKAVQ